MHGSTNSQTYKQGYGEMDVYTKETIPILDMIMYINV